MQDIQSMLPYVYIAPHCKTFLALNESALQYFSHCSPVSSRLLVLVCVGLGQEVSTNASFFS